MRKILIGALVVLMLTGCGSKADNTADTYEIPAYDVAEDNMGGEADEDEAADIINDVDNEEAATVDDVTLEAIDGIAPTKEPEEDIPVQVNTVDLIMFAGQSNMSGCGGDASLAPFVSDEAGMEFRAVSDPTKLYSIVEPFGVNENNINGLMEKPGGKKGSLVSAFVNEYYSDTQTQVIAISASRGEMAIGQFLDTGVMEDVHSRLVVAKNYLADNDYEIAHIYMVWLQGESDALNKTSQETYIAQMNDFVEPLFEEGLQKVFVITPGRMTQYKDIYNSIIDAQIGMCRDDDRYALATSVLSAVPVEYMSDIYHYNQHVLNMVGIEAAKSAAYYSNTGYELPVYDYKNGESFVPNGSEDIISDMGAQLDLSNINEMY